MRSRLRVGVLTSSRMDMPSLAAVFRLASFEPAMEPVTSKVIATSLRLVPNCVPETSDTGITFQPSTPISESGTSAEIFADTCCVP